MEPSHPASPPFEASVYVEQTAALLDLPIDEEMRPQVVEQFERLIEIAHPVVTFELLDTLEPTPVFRPDGTLG